MARTNRIARFAWDKMVLSALGKRKHFLPTLFFPHISVSCRDLVSVRASHRILVSLSHILQEGDASPVYQSVARLIVDGISTKLPGFRSPLPPTPSTFICSVSHDVKSGIQQRLHHEHARPFSDIWQSQVGPVFVCWVCSFGNTWQAIFQMFLCSRRSA